MSVSITDKVAVFAYDRYDPQGGWDDHIFAGTAEELFRCIEVIKKKAYNRDYYSVINLTTLKEISFTKVEMLFETGTLFEADGVK